MKNKISPLLFIIFFYVSCIQGQVPAIERDALIALYNATNGPTWNTSTNWNTAAPVDTWFGVTVNGGNVIGIDINTTNDAAGSNNLLGTIPDEIGNLQSLTFLDLSHNEISGNIPNTILNCTNLESLSIHSNELEGNIPELSTLTNLNDLYIQNNRFQFGDFEMQFNDYNTALNTFNYTPQAKVDIEETITICVGMRINLTTTASGSQNTYQWYKGTYPNGLILAGETNSELVYNSGDTTNAGDYYSLINSNIVSNLTLVREQALVNVSDEVYAGAISSNVWACDQDRDGTFTFNLSINLERYRIEVGGSQQNINIEYFDPQGNLLDLRFPYTNTTPYRQTIIVRVTSTVSNCYAETSFDLIINNIISPENHTACDRFVLPPRIFENYYTEPNGNGTLLLPGHVITTSQTLYISGNGACLSPVSDSLFEITINETPVLDAVADISTCNSYELPALTVGNYYTQPNGMGTQLNAGTIITTTQTIYVYAEVGTTPSCTAENSFDITINTLPNIDAISDQITCDDYTLLPLTSGNYFTATNGGGIPLIAGDLITTSQTIYIYAATGTAPNTCSAESNFSITINNTPIVDTLPNITNCGNYTLPTLTNGNYFTGTNGTGNSLNEGDIISLSQTLFIYAEAPNLPECNAESSFTITINEQPIVDELDDVTSCDSYSLQPLINGNYYTETNGNGTTLNAGESITTSQTIFIFAQTGIAPNICTAESNFTITIIPTETFELTEDNLTLVNQDVTVTINSNQNLEYALDSEPFQTNNVFFNVSEGQHTITVRTEGGCFEDTITFIIKIKKFIIPKFLTPNGDGFKDLWTVIDTENRIKNISIFDRFGKLIKTLTPSSNLSWDGTFNGTQLPTSDYWYTIQLKDNKISKGHFTLKR